MVDIASHQPPLAFRRGVQLPDFHPQILNRLALLRDDGLVLDGILGLHRYFDRLESLRNLRGLQELGYVGAYGCLKSFLKKYVSKKNADRTLTEGLGIRCP